jgi:hypothetical protein
VNAYSSLERLISNLLTAILVFFLNGSAVAVSNNPTWIENYQSNPVEWSSNWRYPNNQSFSSDRIKGYASSTSVNKGSSLTLYVSVNPGSQIYNIDIYRLGYYGGTGGRLMRSIPQLAGIRQDQACQADGPPPSLSGGASFGLVQCNWTPSYSFTIPTSWTSGIYIAKLSLVSPTVGSDATFNYTVFVVRDDSRVADFVYQQSVATYQAYNDFGGVCLYDYCSSKYNLTASVKASFDRPYSGDGAGQLFYRFNSEQKLIAWLEQNGYDVTYTTDVDTHSGISAASITSAKGLLSVGHNEYWSLQMYDAFEHARNRGKHLAFLGANDAYWQIRFENNTSGVLNRIITCYRNAASDPIADARLKTINWRDLGRPEQTLIGVQFGNGKDFSNASTDGLPWIVTNASHWIYAGTQLTNGAPIASVLAQEWDLIYPQYPQPINREFVIVSHSTLSPSQTAYPASPLTTDAVVYKSLSGAYVFGAGTMLWGYAVDSSPLIKQMTKNVLDKFLQTTPDRLDISVVKTITDAVLLQD